jgi:MoaA/NifB/PqqE/SkfB family radical SAM enzyme
MSRKAHPSRILALATETAGVWLRHNLLEPLRARPGLPRAMHYISTHRCNARCVMCGIWKETGGRDEELSATDLCTILDDRLFRSMEYVGISGGEPFLRDDLEEICAVIIEKCASLRRLSLTTNGLLTNRLRTALSAISDRVRGAGALLDVSVSVHGMGETLSRIYGVPNAFEKIERTIKALEEFRDNVRLTFSMNCVLLANNLQSARELKTWAESRIIPLSFVVGERRVRFRTDGLEGAFAETNDRKPLIETRSLACYYAMGGLLLGHDGRLYYCSHSKEIGACGERLPHEIYYDAKNLEYRARDLLHEECRHCPPYTRTRWEIQKDLGRTVLDMVRHRRSRS